MKPILDIGINHYLFYVDKIDGDDVIVKINVSQRVKNVWTEYGEIRIPYKQSYVTWFYLVLKSIKETIYLDGKILSAFANNLAYYIYNELHKLDPNIKDGSIGVSGHAFTNIGPVRWFMNKHDKSIVLTKPGNRHEIFFPINHYSFDLRRPISKTRLMLLVQNFFKPHHELEDQLVEDLYNLLTTDFNIKRNTVC